MRTCKQWREGDENVCSCGYRWDVKDDDPHFENAIYELKQQLIKASKVSDEPVDKCLAGLVKKCLLSDDSDPAHVYGPDFIKRVDSELMK